jgi:hypothetical protein
MVHGGDHLEAGKMETKARMESSSGRLLLRGGLVRMHRIAGLGDDGGDGRIERPPAGKWGKE